MNIHPFTAILPDATLIQDAEKFFDQVKFQYDKFVNDGFFQKAKNPAIYIYKISSLEVNCIGVIAATSHDDLRDNKIKKHEVTIPSKEQHLLQHTLTQKAIVKPVLLGYNDQDLDTQGLLINITKRKPDLEFPFFQEESNHQIWIINREKEIYQIQQIFSSLDKAYIADGHHRTAINNHLYNHFTQEGNHQFQGRLLSMFLPFQNLKIKSYHRILDIQDLLNPASLIASLSRVCKLKVLKNYRKPRQKHHFNIWIDDTWIRCRWKMKKLKKSRNLSFPILDTQLVHEVLFKDVFQLSGAQIDKRVVYFPEEDEINDFTHEISAKQGRIGVQLFPVTAEDLIAVADQDKVLPPKSTWFLPRVKNGLVVMPLIDH